MIISMMNRMRYATKPEKQQEGRSKHSLYLPNLVHILALFLDTPNIQELPLPYTQQHSLSVLLLLICRQSNKGQVQLTSMVKGAEVLRKGREKTAGQTPVSERSVQK